MTLPSGSELLYGKHYVTPEIVVSYDAARCIHARVCVGSLPQVFDVAARPWIQPAHAQAEQVQAVVQRCPSGALHALMTGAQAEQPERPTTITPQPGGPLSVRGDLRIVTPQGEVREVRATLCRCGASSNRPFCDGTHARIGWKG